MHRLYDICGRNVVEVTSGSRHVVWPSQQERLAIPTAQSDQNTCGLGQLLKLRHSTDFVSQPQRIVLLVTRTVNFDFTGHPPKTDPRAKKACDGVATRRRCTGLEVPKSILSGRGNGKRYVKLVSLCGTTCECDVRDVLCRQVDHEPRRALEFSFCLSQ